MMRFSIQVELLKKFKKLVFAISGGKDSMALLHFAINNLNKDTFSVVTIHHNLRGKEGERDRDFVKQYCLNNNIECKVFEEQIKPFCEENGYTIEQGARIRRRQIFKDIVESGLADRVVTAHQKDDQIESILMHIFRGSGIKGLCGMQEDDGILIRPMLNCSSEEIQNYLKDNNIEYVQDSTNYELEYSRNRIRNVVIDEITKVYPGAKDNILRLSAIAKNMQEYINVNTPSFEKTIDGAKIQIKDLKNRDIISSQLIINAVDYVSTRVDLEQAHIDSIFDLIDKENGKEVKLPFNTKAIKEYDSILLTKGTLEGIIDAPIKEGVVETGEWRITFSKEKNDGLRADFDKIKDAIITSRKSGMTFKRFKGGTKSLGDYLTDIKAPKRLRDFLPILAKGQDVLAVLPYEISDQVAIDDNTKNIIYMKAERK